MRPLSLFFAALCACCTTASFAQQRDVRPVEVELGIGMTCGAATLRSAGFDRNKIGETAFAEVRYNFRRLPVDVGFQVRGTIFGREIEASGEKLNYSSGNFMVTADWNLFRRRHPNCVLFAGLGAGMALFGGSAQTQHVGNGVYVDNGSSGSACFMPRVGVELWHHLRVTCGYLVEERANRHLSLTVGAAIGGGSLKKQARPLRYDFY